MINHHLKTDLEQKIVWNKKREIDVWIVADAIIHVWTHHLLLSKCWFLSLSLLFFYLLAEGIIQYRILHDVRWWYDVLILILKIYHVLVTLGLLSYHKWQTAFVVLSSWFFCSVEHMQFQSEKKLSRVQTLVPIQKGRTSVASLCCPTGGGICVYRGGGLVCSHDEYLM
jgi:hypothetical protein